MLMTDKRITVGKIYTLNSSVKHLLGLPIYDIANLIIIL